MVQSFFQRAHAHTHTHTYRVFHWYYEVIPFILCTIGETDCIDGVLLLISQNIIEAWDWYSLCVFPLLFCCFMTIIWLITYACTHDMYFVIKEKELCSRWCVKHIKDSQNHKVILYLGVPLLIFNCLCCGSVFNLFGCFPMPFSSFDQTIYLIPVII